MFKGFEDLLDYLLDSEFFWWSMNCWSREENCRFIFACF